MVDAYNKSISQFQFVFPASPVNAAHDNHGESSNDAWKILQGNQKRIHLNVIRQQKALVTKVFPRTFTVHQIPESEMTNQYHQINAPGFALCVFHIIVFECASCGSMPEVAFAKIYGANHRICTVNLLFVEEDRGVSSRSSCVKTILPSQFNQPEEEGASDRHSLQHPPRTTNHNQTSYQTSWDHSPLPVHPQSISIWVQQLPTQNQRCMSMVLWTTAWPSWCPSIGRKHNNFASFRQRTSLADLFTWP